MASQQGSQIFKIKSSDGEILTAPISVMSKSQKLLSMVSTLPNSDEPIYLPTIKAEILFKVIQYCEHHNKDSSDILYRFDSTDLNSWDKDFLNVEPDTMNSLLLAAVDLELTSLLHTTSFAAALKMKGKLPEEIREMFNIPNDLTIEEIAKITKDNEKYN